MYIVSHLPFGRVVTGISYLMRQKDEHNVLVGGIMMQYAIQQVDFIHKSGHFLIIAVKLSPKVG